MNSPVISFCRVSLIGIILITSAATFGQATKDPKPPPRTGSISGHVLINNKEAASVDVGAFGGADSFNRRVPTAQTKTDSEGYYHLSGLPAANYQVTTFTPNMIAADSDSQFPMGFGSLPGSKTVMLAAGEDVTEIDLKLKRGGVITGRVTDSEDKPIVEERINLQPVAENGQPAPRPPLPYGFMYQTDDRGVYRIYGLPAGRYRVSVGQSAASQGVVSSSANGFWELTFHPDVSDPNRATLVEVSEGGEATNVDIKVSSRKETHALNGRVVDAETNLPISNVRVGIMVMREQGYSSGAVATTAPDGSFTMNGLTGGRYGAYVSSENSDSDFYSDPVPFTMTDQDVGGIEIKALHGTSISGTVVGDNLQLKDLLAQVGTLRVTASVTPLDTRMAPSPIRSQGTATVAPDGSFTISGLRPGRANLMISARDSSKRPALVKITAGGIGVTQGFEIERQPVSGIQLVVTYGTGVIRGSITFQGGTLNGYRTEVLCRRDARTFSGGALIDARGHFTITGLAPGSYDCGLQFLPMMSRPTMRPPQAPHQTVTVSNDAETELNFMVDLTPKGVQP